jgi:hypothetical protein
MPEHAMKPVKRLRENKPTVHDASEPKAAPAVTTPTTPKREKTRRQRLRSDDGWPNPNSKLTDNIGREIVRVHPEAIDADRRMRRVRS